MKSDELLKLTREVEDMEDKIRVCDNFLKSLEAGCIVATIKVSTLNDNGLSYNFAETIPIDDRALHVIQKILEVEAKGIIEKLNKKLDDIKI